MSVYTLLAFDSNENYKAQKIFCVANYANIKLSKRHAPIPCSDAFKRNCSPMGGNPVLETSEGHIFESNAIMRFIARKTPSAGLYGKSEFDAGLVDGWLDLAATELDPLSFAVYGVVFGTKPLPEDFVPTCDSVFGSIDAWLETRSFLVGERLSMADIAVAFSMQIFYRRSGLGEYFAGKHKNLFRLYNTVMSQPQALAALETIGGTFGVVKKE